MTERPAPIKQKLVPIPVIKSIIYFSEMALNTAGWAEWVKAALTWR